MKYERQTSPSTLKTVQTDRASAGAVDLGRKLVV